MAREERMRTIEGNGKSELVQKYLILGNRDGIIKTDVVVVIDKLE